MKSVPEARQRVLDIAGDVEYDYDPETLRTALAEMERAIRLECARPFNAVVPNAAKLACSIAQWVESRCTLHNSVEIHYVVDGYEVQEVVGDGARVARKYKGDTVARALFTAAALNGVVET